jgi:hypothetical protein
VDVLNSKSFWSSLAVIFAMCIVSIMPELQSSEEELVTAFTALGLALVGGHKIKDILLEFVKAWAGNQSAPAPEETA